MSWMIHRIDDRLIHGQVVIAWGERLRGLRLTERVWEPDLPLSLIHI